MGSFHIYIILDIRANDYLSPFISLLFDDYYQLKSMELEVCTAESAQKVGRCLSKFLRDLDNGAAGGSSSQPSKTATPKNESSGKLVNALTNSGALGSSRERKSNNDDSGNNSNNRNDRTAAGRKDGSKQQQRSVHGAAFDRLRKNPPNNQRSSSSSSRTQQQSDNRGRGGSHGSPMNQSRGRNDYERGNNNRRGRDYWGGRGGEGGRGGRVNGGRGDGRGDGGRGRGRENNMGGKRRQRDEDDFVPSAMDRGLQSGRTGDESMSQGRGGRGRGGGRNHGNMQSKRARHEQQSYNDNYAQQGGDNWDSSHWQEGRGRGGRFSTGGRFGRGRGRFSNTFYPNKQNNEHDDGDGEANVTKEAAAVSESPLVAGHFSGGGRGSFIGRGRGRGRFVDGRGRAGRAEVAEMLSTKTWTRPRTMDEGLSASR